MRSAYGLLHDETLLILLSEVAAPHAYGVAPYCRLGQPSDERWGFEATMGKSTPELGSVGGCDTYANGKPDLLAKHQRRT